MINVLYISLKHYRLTGKYVLQLVRVDKLSMSNRQAECVRVENASHFRIRRAGWTKLLWTLQNIKNFFQECMAEKQKHGRTRDAQLTCMYIYPVFFHLFSTVNRQNWEKLGSI